MSFPQQQPQQSMQQLSPQQLVQLQLENKQRQQFLQNQQLQHQQQLLQNQQLQLQQQQNVGEFQSRQTQRPKSEQPRQLLQQSQQFQQNFPAQQNQQQFRQQMTNSNNNTQQALPQNVLISQQQAPHNNVPQQRFVTQQPVQREPSFQGHLEMRDQRPAQPQPNQQQYGLAQVLQQAQQQPQHQQQFQQQLQQSQQPQSQLQQSQQQLQQSQQRMQYPQQQLPSQLPSQHLNQTQQRPLQQTQNPSQAAQLLLQQQQHPQNPQQPQQPQHLQQPQGPTQQLPRAQQFQQPLQQPQPQPQQLQLQQPRPQQSQQQILLTQQRMQLPQQNHQLPPQQHQQLQTQLSQHQLIPQNATTLLQQQQPLNVQQNLQVSQQPPQHPLQPYRSPQADTSSALAIQPNAELSSEGLNKLFGAVAKIRDTLELHIGALRQCKDSLIAGAACGNKRQSLATSALPAKPAQSKKQPDPLDENGDLIEVKRKIKTTIVCKTTFHKLGEIDTLHDKFTAEVIVQAKWREPELDNCTDMKPEDINWNCYWKPKLFIENAIGDQQGLVTTTVTYDPRGRATVVEKRRLKGVFHEFMELNQFPFDTQDVTVSVTSERTDKELQIVEDVTDCCILNTESFAGEQEWHLWKFVKTWRRTRTDDYKIPKTNHSAFSSACRVSRRPEFFIWNILLVMFLICSLAFGTFAVDSNIPQNRLQLAFILVLTTVSFKFVVNQSLPMIAYLTYMDKYILSTMGILVCICVWHSIAPLLNPGNCCTTSAAWADTVALMIFAAIYIGFHLGFVLIILYVVRSVKKESMEHEKVQLEKVAKCNKK